MATTVASYDGKSLEDSRSQWLGWVSIGFLGLNILLLAVVVLLWRYHPLAGTGAATVEVSPGVSSAEVAAKAESESPAPATLRRPFDPSAKLRTGSAQDTAGLRTSDSAEDRVYPEQSSRAQAPSIARRADTVESRTSSVTEVGDEQASLLQEDAAIATPVDSRRTGDLDGDGDVDIFDVVRYASNPKGTDVNGDGMMDVRDAIALDASYGSGEP